MRLRRTFLLSVLVALAGLALVVTGIFLSSLYRKSVERGLDGRLSIYVKMLVANLDSVDQRLEMLPQSIGEPVFDLPLSGWYWQVRALDQRDSGQRTSRSLWESALPRIAPPRADASASQAYGYVQGPENQRLRMAERIVDFGERGRYEIAVAGDAFEIDDQLRFFHAATATAFGLLAILLLLTMFFLALLVHEGHTPQRRPTGM